MALISGADFPHTYGDGAGTLIDWSGVTGVVVCLDCHAQTGPYWSLEDTTKGATAHRTSATHRGADGVRQKLSPEAIAASKHPHCMDCKSAPARTKGLCVKCRDLRITAWLQLNNLMRDDETLSAYRKDLRAS